MPGTCQDAAEMLAICRPGWKSVPGTCPRRARHLPKTRRDASYLRPGQREHAIRLNSC